MIFCELLIHVIQMRIIDTNIILRYLADTYIKTIIFYQCFITIYFLKIFLMRQRLFMALDVFLWVLA